MVVSLAGLIGACCRVNWLLWVYLVVMFLLIVVLICFTVFAFVVTNKGAGEAVSGRGYKEYKLGDYSNWLQKRVDSGKNWNRIRSCLVAGRICQKLAQENAPSTQFFAKHLSPVESGCCKPPDECRFQFVGPTNWTKSNSAASDNPDCNAWSNEPRILCYDCSSCKAGFLQNLKGDWKKVAIINIVFLVFLIIVYTIGCCAFRNNRWDNSNPWKPYR